ncbi:MAG: hypothetical protein R3D32_11540 [Nitratireductor sp.]
MDKGRNVYVEGFYLFWKMRYFVIILSATISLLISVTNLYPQFENSVMTGQGIAWSYFVYFGFRYFLDPESTDKQNLKFVHKFMLRCVLSGILLFILAFIISFLIITFAGIDDYLLMAIIVFLFVISSIVLFLSFAGTWFPAIALGENKGLVSAIRSGRPVAAYILSRFIGGVAPAIILSFVPLLLVAVSGVQPEAISPTGSIGYSIIIAGFLGLVLEGLCLTILVVVLSRAYQRIRAEGAIADTDPVPE